MNKAKKILILHDWKGYLSGKFNGDITSHSSGVVSISELTELLSKNYDVSVSSFAELDLNKNYHDYYVVYASSEERGLRYKEYIEDILLRLVLDGAILIPSFEYFRAHGNKSFQEMLRKRFKDSQIRMPESCIIGRIEEFKTDQFTKYPYVIKSSSGSGSCGVKIAYNREELSKAVKVLSKVKYYDNYYTGLREFGYWAPVWKTKQLIKKILGRKTQKTPSHYIANNHVNKIIIQQFIPDLEGDYKVLYYSGKYYVLNRKNRENDFRASGSGLFSFPDDVKDIADILNFAKQVAEELNVPMVSMDIAQNKEGCFLIEYQCMCFGPYTIQYSEWYFRYNQTEKEWCRVVEKSNIEYEMARSIDEYIKKQE